MYEDIMDCSFDGSSSPFDFDNPFDFPISIMEDGTLQFRSQTDLPEKDDSQLPMHQEVTETVLESTKLSDQVNDEIKFVRIKNKSKLSNKKHIPMRKEYSNVMNTWYVEHRNDPYPSLEQKEMWSQKFGLSRKFINNYFTNLRRREDTLIRKICRSFVNGH